MTSSMRSVIDDESTVPDVSTLVKHDRVHASVYTDPAIFEAEMERIFHRGWVYVGHESEIPQPGDFQRRYVGLQPVIFVRGDDDQIRVLMNRCTHRGAVVCPYEKGNAKTFVCAYHGWAFRNTGKLAGTPHSGRFPASFDKKDHGLRPAPRVASYRGLTFASLCPDGISLDEHLGPAAKRELDVAFDFSPTGTIDVSVGTHKYGYGGNWKLQAENSTDGYHLGQLHRSFIHVMQSRYGGGSGGAFTDESPQKMRSLGNGHVSWDMSQPDADMDPDAPDMPEWRKEYIQALIAAHGRERAIRTLKRMFGHVLIFPNMVVIQAQIRVIRPVSVRQTEVFLYPYKLNGVSKAVNETRLRGYQDFYGPAGGGATDDLEVFERVGEGLLANVDPWILINRGVGREQVDADGTLYGQITDELNSRAILHQWRKLMTGAARADFVPPIPDSGRPTAGNT